MADTHYDLIVIGTGPAGEGAAMKAAKAGKKVAAVEQYSQIGGGATHWATIPSKALRAAILHVHLIHGNDYYQQMEANPTFSLPKLLQQAHQVVEKQTHVHASFFQHNNVAIHRGRARFLDPHRISVQRPSGAMEELTADNFLIGVGSRPYRPADIDFAHPRILDSDKLLSLSITPKSVLVYGAGVIGCEYASMLNTMGMSVTLINTRSRLLSFLDDEISDALSFHFADRGIRILHHEQYEKVLPVGDLDDPHGHVELHLLSGKIIKGDVLLFANGRAGNSDDLGLEHLQVRPNERGQIEVNDKLQVKISPAVKPEAADASGAAIVAHLTGQAAIVGDTGQLAHASSDDAEYYTHIFAAGDVIGVPGLASASYDQGRFAGTLIVSGSAEYHLVTEIPTGIYTSPEISSLGKTEAQLTDEKVPYVAGKALFRTLARAQITERTAGMLKILFHRETLEVLGIHCFGENASEIIHIGQAVMTQPAPHNTLNYFINTTFNYPTMAEAYRVAALSGIDQL